MHWSDEIAEKIIKKFPDKEKYVCAAGITPSGIIHIGNLRDVLTSEFVVRSLKKLGKNAELIWSWDDYDRFRKVPKDVPTDFEKYLGLPLTKIPDPWGKEENYARAREVGMERALPAIGIDARIIYQSKMYSRNSYSKFIKIAMQKRKRIAEILFSFKAQEAKPEEIENFYPLNVYCEACGKDTAKIVSYDEENTIGYECACGHKAKADFSQKNVGKPGWRVDWPMRWAYEDVVFEPGGRDHSSAGGSADVSPIIAKEIFGIEPPIYQAYEWLGITGTTSKMSGSTGEGFTPEMLLEIYEPEIIRWFFARVEPLQRFDFALNDQIIKNYSEWDTFLNKIKEGPVSEIEKQILELSKTRLEDNPEPGSVSFRQLAAFVQIAKGNVKELKKMIESAGGKISQKDLQDRLPRAIAWTERYAPDNYRINLRTKPNVGYWGKLGDDEKAMVKKLVNGLDENWDQDKLTNLIYSVAKKEGISEAELKTRQRDFFKIIYQLLVDSDAGPRLSTFFMAIGKDKVEELLDF